MTDDLPTPPFPLATAMTRVVAGTSVPGACSRRVEAGALHRRRAFCSWVISSYSTLTPVTPGRPRTFDSTSVAIWPRSGQPAVVSATVDGHVAVGGDVDVADHAEVDDAGVQLGVDDPGEHPAHVVGGGRRARDRLVHGGSGVVGIRPVDAHQLIKPGYVLKICPIAATVKRRWTSRC